MIKIIITTLLLNIFTTIDTAKPDKCDIIGKWVFQDLYMPDDLQIRKNELLTEAFSDFKINFADNKSYEIFLEEEEKGIYDFNQNDGAIFLNANNGVKNQLQLWCLNDSNIVLSFKKGKAIVLKRTQDVKLSDTNLK
jgi:hypothetical protein